MRSYGTSSFNVYLILASASVSLCLSVCLGFSLSLCVFYYYLLRMYYTCAMYFDHTRCPLSSSASHSQFHVLDFNPLSPGSADYMHRAKTLYWSMNNLSGTIRLNKFTLLPLAVINCQ